MHTHTRHNTTPNWFVRSMLLFGKNNLSTLLHTYTLALFHSEKACGARKAHAKPCSPLPKRLLQTFKTKNTSGFRTQQRAKTSTAREQSNVHHHRHHQVITCTPNAPAVRNGCLGKLTTALTRSVELHQKVVVELLDLVRAAVIFAENDEAGRVLGLLPAALHLRLDV